MGWAHLFSTLNLTEEQTINVINYVGGLIRGIDYWRGTLNNGKSVYTATLQLDVVQ